MSREIRVDPEVYGIVSQRKEQIGASSMSDALVSLLSECEVPACNRHALSQVCSGDGKVHYHGSIHLYAGSLARVCDWHAEEDRRLWELSR